MSLKTDIAADNLTILNDTDELAVAIVLTDPTGPTVHTITGLYARVGIDIDVNTGLMVTGDKSSIAVALSDLGGDIPTDGWTVSVDDITGTTFTGTIKHAWPDRTIGQVVCLMERTE